jgi:hypothetical protein
MMIHSLTLKISTHPDYRQRREKMQIPEPGFYLRGLFFRVQTGGTVDFFLPQNIMAGEE